MMDSFLVIFSNISKQLFQGTPSDGCILKVFCSTEASVKVLEKLLISENFRTPEEIVRWDIYFFNFKEENHSTIDGFLRFLWNVLKQLF